MLITDLKREFYDQLLGKRVLLLVHCDLDAACASKILQFLFRTDHILYTLVPVQSKTDLLEAFQKHSEQIKYTILINCGGCIDILEFFQPPEHSEFFIADIHRPLDVCNIYNEGQVKIISPLDEDEKIPAIDDIFRDDSEEEEESEDEESEGGGKRLRLDEEALEKRRERRLWTQRRQKLLFDYSQFSYYGESSGLLFYELSWKLSRDSNEVLWWAILGVTDLLLSEKCEQANYLLLNAKLQNHVKRLNHSAQDEKPLDSLRISFDKELQLALYRHWTLVESMRHSPYVATTLKLWTIKGEKRMHELLAEVGLPLVECRQKFCSMDVSLRNEVQALLESKAEKYGLTNLVFASFTLSHGFKNRFCAMDYSYATLALMESSDKDKTAPYCFLDVMDSLSVSRLHVLHKGISASRQQLEAIYRQVTTFLNMNQVISAGPFLYATVLQGCPDAGYFSSPNSLSLLARFTLKAHVAMARNKKAVSLPLVLTSPEVRNPFKDLNDEDQTLDTCLVCGIPPLSEESPKNFFGKAFEQAAAKTNSRADLNFFDTNIIRLCVRDRSKFFDALIALLS